MLQAWYETQQNTARIARTVTTERVYGYFVRSILLRRQPDKVVLSTPGIARGPTVQEPCVFRSFSSAMATAGGAVGTFSSFAQWLMIASRISLCRNDADEPGHRLYPPLQGRRRLGAVSCTDLLLDDVGSTSRTEDLRAQKATPSRSWSISSLHLRRVVPGAHWRGRPRSGSRQERAYGKIGRGP